MDEMTVNEAAMQLCVSTQTIRRWIATGRLRATRAGRVWRIRPADVEQLTRNGRRFPRGTTEMVKPGTVGALLRYLKTDPHFATPEDVRELEHRITEARRQAREQAGVQ